MPSYSPDNLSMKISLGGLFLHGLDGVEEMSGLFSFTLLCHSADADIAPDDLKGRDVGFAVRAHDGSWRNFHGFIIACAPIADGSGQPLYRLRVAPKLWLLNLSSDNRIYQDKDVKEILAAVLDAHGVAYDVSGLSRQYEKREYCVQYNETAFNFVSRLMEDEGIFYWFKHEESSHVLMLGDSIGAYEQARDAEVAYRTDPGNASGEALLIDWVREQSLTAGSFTVSDYDYKKPDVNMENSVSSGDDGAQMASLEKYRFPAMRRTTAAVKASAENDKDAHLAATDVATGKGYCRGFSPGLFFTLGDAPYVSDKGQTFVLTQVEHKAHGSRQKVGSEKPSQPSYSNTFTCIPQNRAARPLKQTPVPKVNGVETAIVTGPDGEDVYTDELGRVKVHFNWDRGNSGDDQSSCWVRVMHNQVGSVSVPRVGREVIVSFEQGSPDRPVITGSLYNEINNIHASDDPIEDPIAFDLDWEWGQFAEAIFDQIPNDIEDEAAKAIAKKSVELFKKITRKYRRGWLDKFSKYSIKKWLPMATTVHKWRNHLKFVEFPGEELVDLYAAKDFSVKVGDCFDIKSDDILVEAVKDFMLCVQGNALVAHKGDAASIIEGEHASHVGKNSFQEIKGNAVTKIKGNVTQEIKGHSITKIDSYMRLKIEKNNLTKIEGDDTLEVKKDRTVKAKNITLDADSAITLKVGGSTLEIKSSGITIKSPKIEIKADASAEIKAPKIDVKADAMLTLDGGVVMIG